jgi:hypothetical protein
VFVSQCLNERTKVDRRLKAQRELIEINKGHRVAEWTENVSLGDVRTSVMDKSGLYRTGKSQNLVVLLKHFLLSVYIKITQCHSNM